MKKPTCESCGSEDLYIEVKCPGPSVLMRGAYLKGGIFVLCRACNHSKKTAWPKEQASEQA